MLRIKEFEIFKNDFNRFVNFSIDILFTVNCSTVEQKSLINQIDSSNFIYLFKKNKNRGVTTTLAIFSIWSLLQNDTTIVYCCADYNSTMGFTTLICDILLKIFNTSSLKQIIFSRKWGDLKLFNGSSLRVTTNLSIISKYVIPKETILIIDEPNIQPKIEIFDLFLSPSPFFKEYNKSAIIETLGN